MATYNIDKITSPSGDVYKLQDKVSGFTTNTGTVTSVTAGTGLKIGTATSGGSITTTGTINHINSVTAGTAGTSSATSGNTLAVPYITYDAQGHITATGTHTHTVTGFATITNLVNGSATGSVRGTSTTSESDTYTIGRYAFAEGNSTTASGLNSHAEGSQTTASGDGSHAEGSSTIASSDSSHAEGNHTTASGMHSHAEGFFTTASGDNSHAEGFYTTASNSYCSAEGYYATASGFCSHAEGYRTTASGYYSHANGYYTVAQREAQTVIGKYNILDTKGSNGHKLGDYAFIIGNGTAEDARSNALAVDWNGNLRISGTLQDMSGASLIPSIPSNLLTNLVNGSATGSVRGINTSTEDTNYTIGTNAMVVGYNTRAVGEASFAEGYVDSYEEEVPGGTLELSVTASSVIENYTDTGYLTITFTDPQYSLADLSVGDTIRCPSGSNNPYTIETIDLTNNRIYATGSSSDFNWATNKSAIITTTQAPETVQLEFGATGFASHAEGVHTLASGDFSHAEGNATIASGRSSHAGGWGTIAASQAQTVIGAYNIADEDSNYIFIIGNSPDGGVTRSNALRVDWDGNLQIAGDLQDMDGNSLISGGGGGSSTGTEVHYVDVVKGTAPSSQKYTEFRFKERNGTLSSNVSNLAVFGVTADTNGDYRTYMRGYYPIANNSDSANITITTRPNGNNWIDLESWVNVLGGHLDICSPSSGVLGFRYNGAASATATITNTSGSTLATNGNFNVGGNLTATGNVSASNGTLTSVSFSRNLTSGTKIGTITIDGTATDLYCQTNTNTTYTIATGDSNGQIKVTPSSGTAYNVSVKGLGSAAYTASTDYAPASHTHSYLPLTGGTISGSIAISAVGKGFNLTDSSGTTYGGLYENGNNLWIGAASSDSPHHRGSSGYIYISSGYNNGNSAGNSTIYIWVPTLSGSTWGGTSYGVLHTGNYNSYALPLSGGTLTGTVTINNNVFVYSKDAGGTARILTGCGSDNNMFFGYGSRAANQGASYFDGHVVYIRSNGAIYMQTASGASIAGGSLTITATDTGERFVRAANSNGSIELNASSGNKGVYDRSGGRWIIYLATNSTANTAVTIPRGLQVGEAGINGYIELYHATPYIDFHYGRSTADYTTRLWESSSGTLTCTGYLTAKLYNGSSAQVVGSNSTDGNRVALFAAPGATTFQIGAQWGGSTYSTKNVTVSSSDVRLKENIKDAEVEALPIINQMKVREFDWNDGRHQIIGVVADELEEIDEKLAVGGGYNKDGSMNIKSVDTFYLTGYLTKGIQELSKENEELKKRIKKLETTLSKISVS